MSALFVFGFIALLTFGMYITWPLPYRGGGTK